MRKLLMLPILAISIIACETEPKVDYALFSGKVENPTEKNDCCSRRRF